VANLPAWQLDQVVIDLQPEPPRISRASGKHGAAALETGGTEAVVKHEGGPSSSKGHPHHGHAAEQAPVPGAVLLPDGVMLVVLGANIDQDKKWRHAGGPEEWRVSVRTG
jgi:hypothetical protein